MLCFREAILSVVCRCAIGGIQSTIWICCIVYTRSLQSRNRQHQIYPPVHASSYGKWGNISPIVPLLFGLTKIKLNVCVKISLQLFISFLVWLKYEKRIFCISIMVIYFLSQVLPLLDLMPNKCSRDKILALCNLTTTQDRKIATEILSKHALRSRNYHPKLHHWGHS